MKPQDYVSVHSQERDGTLGEFGLKILMAYPGRDLTSTIRSIISRHSDELAREVMIEFAKAAPEGAAEHAEWVKGLTECFQAAERVYVEEVPNEYCSGACCVHRPWLIVTTSKGRIKIGPRKRVIVVDWSDSQIKSYACELFQSEDVTKDGKMIHAWGEGKAREYLAKLLGA